MFEGKSFSEACTALFVSPKSVAVSEVNGPDIKSENDFGKTTVKAVEKSATADGRKLRYTFPPHSYTMLKARLS